MPVCAGSEPEAVPKAADAANPAASGTGTHARAHGTSASAAAQDMYAVSNVTVHATIGAPALPPTGGVMATNVLNAPNASISGTPPRGAAPGNASNGPTTHTHAVSSSGDPPRRSHRGAASAPSSAAPAPSAPAGTAAAAHAADP